MKNTIKETLDLVELMKRYADKMGADEEEKDIADSLINLSTDIFMNMLIAKFE